MEGAREALARIGEIRKLLPDYGRELDQAAQSLRFYFRDTRNRTLPSRITGIEVPSEQTAIHSRSGEVFVNNGRYRAKPPRSKLSFLLQEILEEQLLKARPGMDPTAMHKAARGVT